MRTDLFLCLVILGFAGPATSPLAAQGPGALHGRVLDAAGDPIVAADVLLEPGGRRARADSAGRFRWQGLAPGRYRVTAAHAGYAPRTREVVLEPGSAAEVVLRLAASPLELPGLHASAGAGVRPLAAVTQGTSVLSGRALEREVSGSVAQTLRHEPGVAVRSLGPGASLPVLRGLTGDRILVLQDGQRTADLAGSADDHGTTADPLAAERIEVVRGPATLLYGNNAVGGVVNVVSGDVPFTRPARTRVTLAAQSESALPGAALSARAEVPVADAWVVVLRTGGRRAEDMRIARDAGLGRRLRNTAAHSANGAAGVAYVSGAWRGGSAVRGYAFEYGLPVPSGEPPVDLRGARVEWTARVEGDVSTAGIAALRADASLQRYDHDELDGDDVVQQRFALDTRTLTVQLQQRPLGVLRGGALGISVLSRSYAATGPSALTPPAESRALGVFLFEELQAARGPALQLGARWDLYATQSHASAKFGPGIARAFSALSGSVGLRQAIGEGASVSVSAARSFRAPTVEELFSGAPHAGTGAVEYGTPTLAEERGRTLEALLQVERATLRLQLAAWRTGIDDFVQLELAGDTMVGGRTLPVFRYHQQAARLQGAEAIVELALGRRLVAGLRGDALHAETTAGVPLSFMPPPRAGFTLRWDDGRFSAGGDVHREWAQRRVGSAQETPTDAHAIVRLHAGLRLRAGGREHSFTVRVDNLGNEAHREATSRTKEWAPGPGRSVAVGYRGAF